MKDFSEVLRELRKEKGLTQKKLAEELGLTERSIRHYEARTHRPDIDILIRIARYFDVSLDYLAGLKDER
mgnify:FL=1